MPALSVNDCPVTAASTLRRFMAQHERVLVITGAGLSTASGIPDYRDAQGQWKQSHPLQWQQFIRDPHARRRYWARSLIGWPRFARAQPNDAHHALAALEAQGHIQYLITQNVDRLHQRAGQKRVIDLHGRLDCVDCLNCQRRFSRVTLQRWLAESNPDFLHYSANSAPDGDARLDGVSLQGFRVPDCPHCGGLLKPSVVFFVENVPRERVAQAYAQLEHAAALLVIGSSLMVYSGYRFCRKARDQGKPIAALNLGRTRADPQLALKISLPCAEVLAACVGH